MGSRDDLYQLPYWLSALVSVSQKLAYATVEATGVKFDKMEVGMAAMKTFANPGIDIVKTLPEGIVELVLRGVAIVSSL